MEMSVDKKPKPGLYANINAKRARIKAGSGEEMRKVGSKGAPTAKAFKQLCPNRRNKLRSRLRLVPPVEGFLLFFVPPP
jgi:hypothetical protein